MGYNYLRVGELQQKDWTAAQLFDVLVVGSSLVLLPESNAGQQLVALVNGAKNESGASGPIVT